MEQLPKSLSAGEPAARYHKMEKFGTMWAKKLANFKYQPLTSSCFVLIQTVNITSKRNRRLPVFYFGYFPEALKDTEQE